MARSLNQVTLMGNLTRDPELRTIPSGQSVCSFSLALNRSYKDASGNWVEATDFVDCVAWGPLGERVSQYLTKGRPCLVTGRLQSSSWEDKTTGAKRSKLEVNAGDVTFLGGPGGPSGAGGEGDEGGSGRSSAPAPAPARAGKKVKEEDVVIEDIGDEPINLDDIPF